MTYLRPSKVNSIGRGIPEILNLFSYSNDIVNQKVLVQDVDNMAKLILEIDFAPSKLDIGLLTLNFYKSNTDSMKDFLSNELYPLPLFSTYGSKFQCMYSLVPVGIQMTMANSCQGALRFDCSERY